jgi:hypothetical protein
MGGDHNAAVPGNSGAQAVKGNLKGAGQKIPGFSFNVVVFVNIDLVAGFFRIVRKREDHAVSEFGKRKACLKSGKEAEYVDLFLGGGFHAEKGQYSQRGAGFGKGRAVKAGIVIRQGQDLHSFGSGDAGQGLGREIKGTAGREAGMIVKIRKQGHRVNLLSARQKTPNTIPHRCLYYG